MNSMKARQLASGIFTVNFLSLKNVLLLPFFQNSCACCLSFLHTPDA